MPYNGSGTWTPPSSPGAFNPAITGQNATPAAWNTLLADIATGLSTAITKDGQTTITQNIPFAAKKITDLGNATALTDALNQQGAWFLVESRTITAQSVIDFTGIPATYNNLQFVMQLRPSTNAITMNVRTYGADGVLDTGASDYSDNLNQLDLTANTVIGTTAAQARLSASANVGNGTDAFISNLTFPNIQSANYTRFLVSSSYFNSGATSGNVLTGVGVRNEADRITGVRIYPSSGTVTGRVTLFASV